MNLLLQIGLANVAVAAVLAVVAFIVGKVCRRPALVHSLWLLVLLKLVTPPLFWLPITWEAPPEVPTCQAAIAAHDDCLAVPAPPPPDTVQLQACVDQKPRQHVDLFIIQSEGRLFAVPVALAMKPPTAPPPPPPPEPSQFAWLIDAATAAEPWLPILFWTWVLGAVAWFVWAGSHLVRFQRLLRFGRPAPESLQRESDRLAEQMGLSRGPAVWLLPGALPPLVWSGVGRARVFFPQALVEQLSDDERASLLVHELAHVCRRDHWVRALELVVMGLYWWCPLVWWARRQIHVHEEECCDAWVVGELPARSYASAILRTLDFLAEGRQGVPVAASGLSTRVQQLKKRLTQIMRNQTPKRLSVAGQLTVVILALLLLPLLPTIVLSRAEPVPPVVPPVEEPTNRIFYAATIQAPPLTTVTRPGDSVAVFTTTAAQVPPQPAVAPQRVPLVHGEPITFAAPARAAMPLRAVGGAEQVLQFGVIPPQENFRFSAARVAEPLPGGMKVRLMPLPGDDRMARSTPVFSVAIQPRSWLLESSPNDELLLKLRPSPTR